MIDTSTPKGAILSPCRRYRYALWRTWGSNVRPVVFIGLNPSTADETQDDPTIRRCVGFAKTWGHTSLVMLNLFAWRSTDPKGLLTAEDPIGVDNNHVLYEHGYASSLIVAAWGAAKIAEDRGRVVRGMLLTHGIETHNLGLTKDGRPKHPLYLRADTKPERWTL